MNTIHTEDINSDSIEGIAEKAFRIGYREFAKFLIRTLSEAKNQGALHVNIYEAFSYFITYAQNKMDDAKIIAIDEKDCQTSIKH